MRKTVVINIVGLSKRLIGDHTPFIREYAHQGQLITVTPAFPAVTCTAQSTYLTGKTPSDHGIVGNGWYFKEECEVKFWRQSNKLVESEKIWERLKLENPDFSCANLFWWYNMYSSADYSVTPRPNYLADGRKIPDIYTHPPELRDHLQRELGTFPLFHFWGPRTSIKSSRWIARAAMETEKSYNPTLTLIYLPHLDYNLQRFGNSTDLIGKDLEEIDKLVKELVDFYTQGDCNIVLLSEYGITGVSRAVHINRVLREHGYLAIREERGLELLDAGASRAFAVADHQVAHVYCNDPTLVTEVKQLLESQPGIEKVLRPEESSELNHKRAGDLLAVAEADTWFTYYYWLDDKKAPDFARTVDIHKKPGYDPVEMFTDPKDKLVGFKVLGKLFKKKLGFRTLMDLIPLDSDLVRGSHGRIPEDTEDFPIFITGTGNLDSPDSIEATEVYKMLYEQITK